MPIVDERVCTKCRSLKPLLEFSAAPRGKYGRKSSCKACDAERHARLHPPKPRKTRPLAPPKLGSTVKVCRKCGLPKTLDEFSLASRATEGRNAVYRSWCKPCNSERAMQWYRDNTERANASKRRFNLRNLYGVTQEEYDAMMRRQGNVCAVCGNGREGRLHVDHDHETGKVRGLLCNRCNRAIGLFGDDPIVLRKAIAYLIRARDSSNGDVAK